MSNGAWWSRTWNPVIGCSHKGQGCVNCWAERWAHRHAHNPGPAGERYAQVVTGGSWNGHVARNVLQAPTQGKEEIIAVNFMGDLFHSQVPTPWLDEVFSTIEAHTEHNFVLITKRPANMAKYLQGRYGRATHLLMHVWAVTSASTQREIIAQAPDLLNCEPFVDKVGLHLEPLIEQVDLNITMQELAKANPEPRSGDLCYRAFNPPLPLAAVIDWVVVGGENGPGARPMQPEWVVAIREAAIDSDLHMWMKGWGPKLKKPPAWARDLRCGLYPQELPTGYVPLWAR